MVHKRLLLLWLPSSPHSSAPDPHPCSPSRRAPPSLPAPELPPSTCPPHARAFRDPESKPRTARPAVRTRPRPGETGWAGPGEGKAAVALRQGEVGGPRRGESRACTRQPPQTPPGFPTPGPESGSVPHTLQQAPPLRRHLGGTPRARPPPASRRSRREGWLERPGAAGGPRSQEHAHSATPWPRRDRPARSVAQARSSTWRPD